MYGSVYPLRVDASCKGEVPLGKWKSPFVVWRQLGRQKIVYGSISHLMYEAARPFFQMSVRQEKSRVSLPTEIREAMVDTRSGEVITSSLPSGDFPPAFIYEQDEIMRDALLLAAPHVRTLIEIFSGKGNRIVPTYDYDGNQTGGVSMQRLFSTLSHHRYCVVSGGFLHDIFSDQDTPGLPDEFGTKIEQVELIDAVFEFLDGITVNDFVGMLRGRLEHLTVDSKARDIIFAHQNVVALDNVVEDRLSDASFQPFLNFLFRGLTANEDAMLAEAASRGETEVRLTRVFPTPSFQISDDLSSKVIRMHITINGKAEKFEFEQQEFFGKLTATCGTEPLLTQERLGRRFAELSQVG